MISLRAPTPNDEDAMVRAFTDPVSKRFGGDQTTRYYPSAELFAVVDGERAVGRAEILRIKQGIAEIAYYLVPERRGEGLGTETVAAICDAAIARGARFCAATIHPDNAPSSRACLRNGFRLVPAIVADGKAVYLKRL